MKKKVLVSVLACALLFLGMGYAYWTDSLQVDTSVSTGELDVKFVDLGVMGVYGNDFDGVDFEGAKWTIFDGIDPALAGSFFAMDGARWNTKTNYNILADQDDLVAYKDRVAGYTKTDFDAVLVDGQELEEGISDYIVGTIASDKIEIDITDIYPGYAQLFRADIVNPGTLAAKLSGVSVVPTSAYDKYMRNMIGVSLEVLREDGNTGVVNLLEGVEDGIFEVGGKKFIRLSALDKANKEIGADNILRLYPANSNMDDDQWRMDLFVGVAMDPDYEGNWTSGHCGKTGGKDDSLTQNNNASFAIKLCWDQFNTEAQPQ